MRNDWASYDAVAATFEAIGGRRYFQATARQLIAFANLSPRDRLLDVGAGTGAVARAALAAVPKLFVVAADPSLPMLRFAQDRGVARNVVSRVPDLPFAPKSFHCITASFVLNHFADCEAGVWAMTRLLRERGELAVTSWAAGPSANPVGAAWNGVAHRFAPEEELRAAVERAMPSEARLKELDALTTVVRATGLTPRIARQIQFRTTMSTEEYITSRGAGIAGRFLKTALPSDAWDQFTREASTALRAAFGEAVEFTVGVNFVVGQR
jgi:ubiquinone/menaquinone biosynthesis C-methylase UbiE